MDLKGLIHRELGEGLTEKELATAVGVSLQTIEDILSHKAPEDPAIWEKFATHFRMDVDFLQTGESRHSLNPRHVIRRRPALSSHRDAESPLAHLALA